jgi:hypothetical protein
MVGLFKNNLKGVQIPKFCTFGSFIEFLNVFIFHPILMYFWQNESDELNTTAASGQSLPPALVLLQSSLT